MSIKTNTIGIDKVYHFAASYALVLTANLVMSLAFATLLALAIGILKEVYDHFDYGRFDVNDIIADAAGVALGALVIYLTQLFEVAI